MAQRVIPSSRPWPRTRLGLNQLERRETPSASIPISGSVWTPVGPSPIINGQAPGNNNTTGYINGIAVDSDEADIIYAAAATGGVWRSLDGGENWSPRTDRAISLVNNTLTALDRGPDDGTGSGNTVYVATEEGILKSVDGAETFAPTDSFIVTLDGQFVPGTGPGGKATLTGTPGSPLIFSRIIAVPDADTPDDPTTDILYVGLEFGRFTAGLGTGVYRSLDGGETWAEITQAANGNAPFFTIFPIITDIAIDPTNPNVLYVAAGNPAGDASNGIYRTLNGLSDAPVFTNQIGGSAFVPGTLPGDIKLAVSPVLPSVIFASVAERLEPSTGWSPVLDVFRSLDSGVNWTRMNIDNRDWPDGQNYMGIEGENNNVIAIDPASPANPFEQRLIVGGYGDPFNNFLVSVNSGVTFSDISLDIEGDGPGVNSQQIVFDPDGRLLVANSQGVFRASFGPLDWSDLNGSPGQGSFSTALSAVQAQSVASHPTDPNRLIANIGLDHNAALFNDFNGWMTTDSPTSAPFQDGREGFENTNVIWNYNQPETIYRQAFRFFGANDPGYLRRSTDGGQSWVEISAGITGLLNPDRRLPVQFLLDPSVPTRLFAGTDRVNISNNNGDSWGNQLQTGAKTNVAVPDLPSSGVPRDKGGEIYITALATSRSGGGQKIYAATEVWNNTDNDDFLPGFLPRLFYIQIPDSPPNPALTSKNWVELTAAPGLNIATGFSPISQLVIDPANQNVMYGLITDFTLAGATGRVVRTTDGGFSWVDLTGTLGTDGRQTFDLVLDPNNPAVDNDDVLYIGTDDGVYSLTDPTIDPNLAVPNWIRFGESPTEPTLPNVQVRDLDLNPTTGILTAATNGRGVWQIRIRGLIRGQVFDDLNGNKARDTGETPLTGWTVVLRDGGPNGPQVAATQTDADGFYEFASLREGTYYVEVITEPGFIQTTKLSDPIGITLTTAAVGESVVEGIDVPPGYIVVPELDVGAMRFATITGKVFADTDADGQLDFDEIGREGITVFLDANFNEVLDSGELTDLTDFAGGYAFGNIGAGPFRVRIVVPPNEELTTPPPADIFPESGQTVTVPPIGLSRIARVGGSVFDDLNGNGIRDAGEPGLVGASVDLINTITGTSFTLSTDAAGNFLFLDLEASTYRLELVEDKARFQTTVTPDPFIVGPTDKLSGYEFGSFLRVTITGAVFNDLNGNGSREAGEPGLPNWTVQLLDPATGTKLSQVSTDAAGDFAFPSLIPGQYRLREVLQSGFTQTTANPADVTIGPPGAKLTGYEFGNFQFAALKGTVFEDVNRNKVRDAGEPGLAGVTVYLDLNTNGKRDLDEPTRVTAEDGTYLFDGLLPRLDPVNPGEFLAYPARQVLPSNYVQTTADPAGFFATSGAVGTADFGNALTGSIGGLVFNDLNGNGVRESDTEPGLSGVTVQLLDPVAGTLLRTVTTDANGNFTFESLGGGSYRVRQTVPNNAVQTTTDPADLVLSPSTPVVGQTFGNFYRATIVGLAFSDANANGEQDSGEVGLPGFTLYIDANLNGKLDSGERAIVTDNSGSARFDNLSPGTYQLRQAPRDGFTLTTAEPAPVTPASGGTDSSAKFGNFQDGGISGVVFLDRDNDGVRDEGEPGLIGFTVRLDIDGDGQPDRTDVTDQFGAYAFSALGPGKYTVSQVPRTGFTLTTTDPYVIELKGNSLVTDQNFANTSPAVIVAGADAGGLPLVEVRDFTGAKLEQFAAFDPNFRGGVRAATGFLGTAQADVVVAPGAGGGPNVRVFTADGLTIRSSFFAYDPAFPGGVYVAVGDVTGDGIDDIVTGADAGGGPHVRVFDGATIGRAGGPVVVREFFPYDARFTGGVRVGVGDVDGDGRADVITAPGIGGGPHVRVFSGATGVQLGEFFAYGLGFTGGVYVSAGDLDADGKAEVITGAGRSGGPHVRAFSVAGVAVKELFAYPLEFRGGVRVGTADLDFDGRAEILTSPGPGRASEVRAFDPDSLAQKVGFVAFDPTFLGGVFVG